MSEIKLNISKTQIGFTLVELLVALALGLLMTAAVVQTYLSTKQTYQVTNGIGRIQENARFGHYFITRDLRLAGSRGCVNGVRNMLSSHPSDEFMPFKNPVNGWEYNNSSQGDTVTLPTALQTPGAGSWSGDTTLPGFLAGNVVSGSDVLQFQYFEKQDIILADTDDEAFEAITTANHDLDDDSILLVGNCAQASLFQHNSGGGNSSLALADDTSTPGNDTFTGTIWGNDLDADTDVYQLVRVFYFIDEGASGLPALIRIRNTSFPESAVNREELVEGVETLQVYYGEDTNDDNNPNRYVDASAVTDWEKVVSVRVGLLFRSTTNATDQDQATDYTLLDNIDITHAADDNLLRYAVNSTVKLRNRGFAAVIDDGTLCNAPEFC